MTEGKDLGDNDYLNSSEFTQDQKTEIEKGILDGLDVSVYAKPEFLAIQMFQIRLGMLDKLPVEKYASTDYDWFQMEEIRLGLKSGVDISKYASPDVPFDIMRQIRKGLEKGIDLSMGKNFKAGVLKQLRHALSHGVDIRKYIKQGYEEEQLEQIRKALEKKIDIDPYISLYQRGPVIREIVAGLEEKLDVSLYANEQMNWQQMREVRLGLEERLDVSVYNKPLYSWQQMREIRLGLENNLPVENYSSFMYTANEMKKRRLKLMEGGVKEEAEETAKQYQNFLLMTSPDFMEAYIMVSEKGVIIPSHDLLDALKRQHIIAGIDYAAIKRLETSGADEDMITIARGIQPSVGKDGWYEFLFDTDIKSKPTILENGSVDYQHIKWFEIVKKDQPIAYYHKAEPGRNGSYVNGEKIPGIPGKEMPAIKGSGFRVLPDHVTYVAATDGKVEYKDGRLEVTNLLVLESLTKANGSIYFDGSIYVRGTIGDGVELRATKDILVDGFTESAMIEAGGDVILREGNNAGGRGYIKAERDVMGKFFENARIIAGGSIKANYCLNSVIDAEKDIEISGEKAILAGGISRAGENIISYYIGNVAGVKTMIQAGRQEKYKEELTRLDIDRSGVERELVLLKTAYNDMKRKMPPEVRNSNPMYLKIEQALYIKESELNYILKNREDIQNEAAKNKHAKVVVQGIIYQGVRMNINGARWESKQTSNVTFRNRDGVVSIYRNI